MLVFFFPLIEKGIEIVSVQYLIFDFWNSEDCSLCYHFIYIIIFFSLCL